MSKLLDNHIAVSTLTGTKVRCRLLTKIRDCIPHKNEKNHAPEVLNDAASQPNDAASRLMMQTSLLNDGLVEW